MSKLNVQMKPETCHPELVSGSHLKRKPEMLNQVQHDKRVNLTINGKKVKAKEGMTLWEISRKMSISIPTLCYHPDLTAQGSCRLCTVEVSENGKTRMVTACNYPAREGIEVETHSERVRQIRRVLVGLLLARCPQVPFIQNLAGELGVKEIPYKSQAPGSDCLLCGLCVRTCDEIVGANAIGFSRRGMHKKIGTPFEIDSETCVACGACETVCPTGAVRMEMDRIRMIRRSDTGTRRYCRYMRLGLVDFMVCSNGYECWRCEVDQGMEDRFGRHPAFALKPGKNKEPVQVSGFTYFPEYFYSKGHLWVKPMDLHIRLGFDDLVSNLAMEADSIKLPRVGSSLKKDQVLAEIAAAGKKAKFLSPLTGKVSAVNRDVEETPKLAWRDPYRRGWLLMIEPGHPEEISRLYSDESARAWFTEEAKKVAKLFAEWGPNRSRKDGPSEDEWIRKITRKHWDRLTETLLRGQRCQKK
jgi:bidirectional [NiFe] hydrogenase diaphorase subunit